MDATYWAVAVIEANGTIREVQYGEGYLDFPRDIAGRTWNEVFASWGAPAFPLTPTTLLPLSVLLTPTEGDPITLQLLAMGHGASPETYLALFHREATPHLTEKQQQLCGLGEISAGVAHEMNNALTLLVGWLDILLSDYASDEKLRPTLELLMNEANRISRLTRNLLEVSRGASDASRDLDVRSLLDEVLLLVRYEMRTSNIELESHVGECLPRIHGSPGRLKQAMLNLLLNAQQAMPSGGKVTVSAETDPDGFVRLDVADTGCGIPPELQARIFSPFFTTKQNGTGLGLSVTRTIVEDHGGTLSLESAPGAGARFTLRLPTGVA